MSKINKTSTLILACTAGCFLSSTNADILFFLLDEGGQEAWDTALVERNLEIYELFNITRLYGDPGIYAIDGPLILGKLGMDSNFNPFGEGGRAGRGEHGTGLRVLGASNGFGNTETAILAGHFNDSFDFFTNGEELQAVEITPLTILGSNTVDISVYDMNENEIARLPVFPAPAIGNRLGILATDGDVIGRINIYDTSGGAEGMSGDVITYIPAPSAIALVSMGMLIKHRRRKR